MDAATRGFFEQRFDQEFGRVRIHNDAKAASSAAAIGANAYTSGAHIVFARDQYSPSTSAGRFLIAHELVHHLQQGTVSMADNDSDAVATAAMSSPRCAVLQRQSSGLISSPEELVARYTGMTGLDEQGLGDILSVLVDASPTNVGLVIGTLDALDTNNRDEVAYAFVADRPDDFVERLAGYQSGRDLILRIRNEMEGGIEWPWEKTQIERIDRIVTGIAVETPGTAISHNAIAQEVVRRYQSAPPDEQFPGGKCNEVSRERIEEVTRDVMGEDLTTTLPEQQAGSLLEPSAIFDHLWASYTRRDCNDAGASPSEKWLSIGEQYRAKGAAGAMAYANKGTLVDQRGIWESGLLAPGAVIQTWRESGDFQRVKDGSCAESYGHSFLFLRYVTEDDRKDGAIVGMKIMDQGFQSEDDYTLTEDHYGFWVGANITFGPEEEGI